MKKLLLAISIVSLLTLTGCEFTVTGPQATVSSNSTLGGYDNIPTVENEDEILLYSNPQIKLLTYNVKEKKVVKTNSSEDYYQFSFNEPDVDLYTTGYLTGKESRIVEIKDNKLNILYESKDGLLFPVCYKDDENIYFQKVTIFFDTVLCIYNRKTNELTELPNIACRDLFDATLIGDSLYYARVKNPQDSVLEFALYKMDTNTNATPTLVADNLTNGFIFNVNGKLWLSDANNIYDFEDKTNKLPIGTFNFVYGDYLLQIITSNSTRFIVTDINTKEVIKTVDNFISYDIDGDRITVYTTSDIVTIDLPKQQ